MSAPTSVQPTTVKPITSEFVSRCIRDLSEYLISNGIDNQRATKCALAVGSLISFGVPQPLARRIVGSLSDEDMVTLSECWQWRTIESAPRDGSTVYCWRSGWDGWVELSWRRNTRTKTEFWNDPLEQDAYEYEHNPPTHWFPAHVVPNPPEQAA